MRTYSFYLSAAIESVNTEHFSPNLLKLLHTRFKFDSAIAFRFMKNKNPICLLQCENESLNNFNQLYEQSAYLDDPFYQSVEQTQEIDIIQLHEIAPQNFSKSQYYKNFYYKTGWSNEVGIMLRFNACETIGFFFSNFASFKATENQLSEIMDTFALIKSLLTVRMKVTGHGFNTYSPLSPNLSCEPPSKSLNRLTPKEQRVVKAILAGKTSKEIAEAMYITVGTVKNHRKNIYAKLEVKSQCELFFKYSTQSLEDWSQTG